MEDPRIRAALERGWIEPQVVQALRSSVPAQALWGALCQRYPRLRDLGQSSAGGPLAGAAEVAPTVALPSGSGRVAEAASAELRERAAQAYQLARAEDPRFAPHAQVVLQTLHELGRGGMGVVHRVRDARLGREAALKLLTSERAQPELIARFLREAELTASLDHPAIPPIYEAGTLANGQPFLLMKVIEGQPFSEVLRAAGERPRGRELRELLEVVVKVGEAVAHAHGRGVLHRDLKPANVMVGALGEVMVVDWGLARRVDEPDAPEAADGAAPVSDGLTQVGAVLGTPGYLPPEQADGARVDARADVFALGAILTEVLTGAPPVTGATVTNKLAATLQGKIAAPRDRRRDVPPALDAIARRALAGDPSERTQTAAAFVDDLRAFLADEPVSVYREGPLGRARRWGRRHPALAAVLGVTLAGGLVFGGVTAALLGRASSERALREAAEVAKEHAEAMKAEAEAARGKAEQARAETALARDALARKQELLDTLLRIERLPLDDAKVVEELEVFERGLAGAPGEELLRRQLARLYLLHGDWQHAAETALDAALTVSLAEPPPFTDVFTAYALRTTRVGLDEFNRHLEGRGPYFGDLRPSTLEALAARGWPEESGFPAFARALRAVCSEGDQDLTVAEAELGDAVARADHPSTPLGTQAALRIFQGHLAFHRGEARARQGLDPAEEFARAVAFADAALETGAHASFAHLLRALALRATIRDGDPASASPALDACEAALAADPTLGLAYAVRQGIHQRVRAPALVLEADASAALRFRPGDGQLHHWRGQVRLQLGQEGAQPWGAAGWGRRAQADFEAAVATWDRVAGAHGFNVGQVNSRVGLSSALLLQGDLRAALETLERCEALSAGAGSTPAEQNAQRSALTQHVALLLQSQRLDAARPRLERLLARWPDDPNGVYFRGLERLLQGDRPGAEAALARLLELAPESVMARDLREKLAAR